MKFGIIPAEMLGVGMAGFLMIFEYLASSWSVCKNKVRA